MADPDETCPGLWVDLGDDVGYCELGDECRNPIAEAHARHIEEPADATTLTAATAQRTTRGAGANDPVESIRDEDQQARSSRALDRAFKVTLTLKGLDGLAEIIGGIVLLFVAPTTLQAWARSLTAHELARDPHDFIATHLLHSASQLSRSTTLFAAAYLLVHGVTKVVLVVAVLRGQMWAYPWIIALLVVFIVYQVYRLTERFSVGLILLTLFDLLVVWLTWREWGVKRRLEHARVP